MLPYWGLEASLASLAPCLVDVLVLVVIFNTSQPSDERLIFTMSKTTTTTNIPAVELTQDFSQFKCSFKKSSVNNVFPLIEYDSFIGVAIKALHF